MSCLEFLTDETVDSGEYFLVPFCAIVLNIQYVNEEVTLIEYHSTTHFTDNFRDNKQTWEFMEATTKGNQSCHMYSIKPTIIIFVVVPYDQI